LAVSDIDKGWRRIKKELRKLDKSFTKVGLPQEGAVASPQRKGSGKESFKEMSELVIVGASNEFGTKRIPERSFLRSATDENIRSVENVKDKEYSKLLSGTTTYKKALGRVGEFLTGKVKKKIRDLKMPVNAPTTIARKKSANPLVDTGQMVQSIQHIEVTGVTK